MGIKPFRFRKSTTIPTSCPPVTSLRESMSSRWTMTVRKANHWK